MSESMYTGYYKDYNDKHGEDYLEDEPPTYIEYLELRLKEVETKLEAFEYYYDLDKGDNQ